MKKKDQYSMWTKTKKLIRLKPDPKNAMKGSYQNGMKIKKENKIEYIFHLF